MKPNYPGYGRRHLFLEPEPIHMLDQSQLSVMIFHLFVLTSNNYKKKEIMAEK